MTTLHQDELPTDAALVRRLLAAQFPQWAELPVEPLASSGTVNALYRLGGELVVRLLRLEWGARSLALDGEWLPRLAPLLPAEIPVPLALGGEPSDELPWEWGIYPWLEGAHPNCDADPEELAAFVRNLLVRDGRLTGVIDWGSLGVGDPAVDLIPAWGALPADARDGFRAALGVDEATWTRGRGWALSIGLVALPYYVETNPVFAETARVLIRETLADFG